MANDSACTRWMTRILCSQTTKTPQSTKRKEVTFSTVEIRHHNLILGDNPAVSDGVPLTLDWRVEYTEGYDLDVHDNHSRRREPELLFMTEQEREWVARHHGATEECLIEARKQLIMIQMSRKLSEMDQPWGLWEKSCSTAASSCWMSSSNNHQRGGILLSL